MKLVVFGASGRMGIELVRQGVAAGHEVTAVVRQGSTVQLPTPAGSVGGAGEIVTADVMEPEAVASVVEGYDAVLSVLAPRERAGSVLTDGARSVLRAMGETGVRRLLIVAWPGSTARATARSRNMW